MRNEARPVGNAHWHIYSTSTHSRHSSPRQTQATHAASADGEGVNRVGTGERFAWKSGLKTKPKSRSRMKKKKKMRRKTKSEEDAQIKGAGALVER